MSLARLAVLAVSAGNRLARRGVPVSRAFLAWEEERRREQQLERGGSGTATVGVRCQISWLEIRQGDRSGIRERCSRGVPFGNIY